MAKFALECPHCGTINKASTFILAKKVITCGNCKGEINVRDNRMAVGNCKNCGTVAFDQAKGTCPVCKSKIATTERAKANSVEELKKASSTPFFNCPECGCYIQACRQDGGPVCPVCDHKFNGFEEVFSIINKGRLVNDLGISVIKYEGDNETFIWKHPVEDFNMGTVLQVHESQEAIFFLNGQALDLFGSGRHVLETDRIPLLCKFAEIPTGKQSPFHSEVYFINQTVQMGIKWGTDSKVHFIEPNTGIPLDIGASGEMSLRVCDSRKLLLKLVGTTKGIKWDGDASAFTLSLKNAFRPMISTAIKTYLASVIKSEQINILEIDEKLETLSAALKTKITAGFEEYGLTVENFYVTNIAMPEDDNWKKLVSLRGATLYGVESARAERQIVLEKQATELELARIEAEKKKISEGANIELERQKGFAQAEVMRAQGYNQKDVIEADVQKAYAAGIGQMGSGSGGGAASEMVGISAGLAAMGAISGKMNDMMSGMNGTASETAAAAAVADGWDCSCGNKGIKGKFCGSCGAAKPEVWDCSCGATGIFGKFCSECGAAKPEVWACPHCGAKGNKGKFCSECGKSKTASADSWDCSCGNKGITGKFCGECGKKREEV